MKKRLLIVFFTFFLCLPSFLFGEWRPNEMKVKLKNMTQENLHQVADLGIEMAHIHLPVVFLYVTPEELIKIQRIGIHSEVIIDDMATYSQSLLKSQTLAGYHDYYSAQKLADSLCAAFPGIIRKFSYGMSVEGRTLFALKISDNVTTDEAEPEVAFDGGYHGDEIISSEILLRFVLELCQAYGRDKSLTHLVNTREIWIFPFINPDGRQALTRRNSNGVDLNRDWGYMWDAWGDSDMPYSQPETQSALAWLSDHQFVLAQSIHAGMETISYPWSYRPNSCPDHEAISFLAKTYAATSGYKVLSFGQGFNQLYPINGSAKDSYYGLRGALSWALEISEIKSPSPNEINAFYQRNRPAIIQTLEMSGQGIHGKIVSAQDGLPIQATVWARDRQTEFWPVYNDPVVGDFHKLLLPGNYTLKITANGYEDKILSNVLIPDSGKLTLPAIQMKTAEGYFGHQIVACRVPGNNYSDEGLTYRMLAAPDKRYYSLGRNGWAVIDMGDMLYDLPGADLKIFSSDKKEGFRLSVSTTAFGPWQFIANGVGTSAFDIAQNGIAEFRYIRIEDDGDGYSGTDDAGFDLDAIAYGLDTHNEHFISVSGYQIADTLNNFNGIFEAGETVSLTLQLKNTGNYPLEDVSIKVTENHPDLEIYATDNGKHNIPAGGTNNNARFVLHASGQIRSHINIPLKITIRTTQDEILQQLLMLKIRAGAKLSKKTPDVDFAKAFLSKGSRKRFTLFNEGLDTLKIFRMQANSHFFKVNTSQLKIPPKQEASISVYFYPQEERIYKDSLLILSNDPLHPSAKIALNGIGQLAPEIRVPVDSISLEMATSDSAEIALTIQNNGAGELTFEAFCRSFNPPANQDRKKRPLFSYQKSIERKEARWIDMDIQSSQELSPAAKNVEKMEAHPLPFAFIFFDHNYRHFQITQAGEIFLLNPTEKEAHIKFRPVLMPFLTKAITSSRVRYQESTHQVIFEWYDLQILDQKSDMKFQVVLHKNGLIHYHYKNMASSLAPTIGFSPADTNQRVLIKEYLPSEASVIFSRTEHLLFQANHGKILPGDAQTITALIETKNAPIGAHSVQLMLTSNDPEAPVFTIPLRIHISENKLADHTPVVPQETVLQQNYPNPFNPRTNIMFQIPEKTEVRLVVYNTLGQVIRALVNSELAPGDYQVAWEGENDNGQRMPSGIYFYELKTKNFSKIRKMVLLH